VSRELASPGAMREAIVAHQMAQDTGRARIDRTGQES
jgi:hypothetical protein